MTPSNPDNPKILLALAGKFAAFHVGLVADALDTLGRRDQAMAPGLTQLSGPETMAGYALTVTVRAGKQRRDNPYEKEFEAIERLHPGDVLVADCDDTPAAFWGELLTRRAMKRGAVGAIIDGYTRDLEKIRAVEFPVWGLGSHPHDSAGRIEVLEIGGPIRCGGVQVQTGDLVVADCDGIVVVPGELIEKTLELATAKNEVEARIRSELEDGATLWSVFEKYRVM